MQNHLWVHWGLRGPKGILMEGYHALCGRLSQCKAVYITRSMFPFHHIMWLLRLLCLNFWIPPAHKPFYFPGSAPYISVIVMSLIILLLWASYFLVYSAATPYLKLVVLSIMYSGTSLSPQLRSVEIWLWLAVCHDFLSLSYWYDRIFNLNQCIDKVVSWIWPVQKWEWR